MNPMHFAQIGIRLVAIYLIAQGLSVISNAYMVVSSYNQFSDDSMFVLLAMILAVLSPVIIGFILWLLAPKLSRYFLSEPSSTNEEKTVMDLSRIQSMVIALVGVYIVADNIPYSISTTYFLFTNTIEVNGEDTLNPTNLASALSVSLKLLLGVALIVGSKALSNTVDKLRSAGTNK